VGVRDGRERCAWRARLCGQGWECTQRERVEGWVGTGVGEKDEGATKGCFATMAEASVRWTRTGRVWAAMGGGSVIEVNSANDQQQTSVTVEVSTGTVDLTTATYVQGSKSTVVVGGATASLAPESAAMVQNNPKKDQQEILFRKGSGEVTRNGETVHLSDWEKVSFGSKSPSMAKLKEIGPPTPISPANMMPIFVSGEPKPVEFSWTAMANAVGYRLRISRNPYFSSTLVDRKVNTPDVIVSGLSEGAYYWMVQSYDAESKESVESEKNRFTIIPKGKDTIAINLELEPMVQHGHVIELTGKTEVGARVMVNGREVPIIGNDGKFHYFTPSLPPGESVITITAQNSKGGVNTQQKKVVIQ